MTKRKISFCLFLLGILCVPLLPGKAGPNLHGFEAPVNFPALTERTYATQQFQRDFTAWFTRNMQYRNLLLYAKNTFYDWLNLGFFHSGYSGNVLQGKNGILYEKYNLLTRFPDFPEKEFKRRVDSTVAAMKRFSDMLVENGIPLVVVLVPNKSYVFEEAWPYLWEMRRDGREMRDIVGAYAQKLAAAGVPFVNVMDQLRATQVLRESWQAQGTHWNMLGASVTFTAAIEAVNRVYGTKYRPHAISKVAPTGSAHRAERDIADLLNILPAYRTEREEWPFVQYDLSGSTDVPLAIYGDSFADQLRWAAMDSGFTHKDLCAYSSNAVPSYTMMADILKNKKIFIMTWIDGNLFLYNDRINREIEQIFSNIREIKLQNVIDEGEIKWLSATSEIRFIYFNNNVKKFSFSITGKIPSAKEMHVTLNGKSMQRISLDELILPARQEIFLPAEALIRGENIVGLSVDKPATPRALGLSTDSRLLGVAVRDIALSQ